MVSLAGFGEDRSRENTQGIFLQSVSGHPLWGPLTVIRSLFRAWKPWDDHLFCQFWPCRW